MGMTVVAFGLLGLGLVVFVFGGFEKAGGIVSSFSLGASFVALFARVGGGIFTKAADVGADLVGKVEANIPEDDPGIPQSSQITLVIMWVMLPVWEQTCTSPMWGPSSLALFWLWLRKTWSA